jgi:hypothetical protein
MSASTRKLTPVGARGGSRKVGSANTTDLARLKELPLTMLTDDEIERLESGDPEWWNSLAQPSADDGGTMWRFAKVHDSVVSIDQESFRISRDLIQRSYESMRQRGEIRSVSDLEELLGRHAQFACRALLDSDHGTVYELRGPFEEL